MKADKVLLFDLGNVLLPINLKLTYKAFEQFSTEFSADEIETLIKENDLWRNYEAGLQTEEEFRHYLKKELSLECSDSEFDQAFSSLLLNFPIGIYQWIENIKSNYNSLYLLSNTSRIHANIFTAIQSGPSGESIFSLFNEVFFSFNMGLVKPDPLIYKQVSERIGKDYCDIIFFDDNLDNISAATNLGMEAILIDPSKSLTQIDNYLQNYVHV